jgi:hypothetical protein
MLESHKIYLQDRIKETSYTIGTGNFTLNGAAHGFSSFGSVYSNGSNIFYAATDGSFYEVGSGVYVTGVQNSIIRFPFRSTNNNNIVSFGEGLKEIFVTYPATNSVYTASGIQGSQSPKESGLAFWSSSNIINYNSNLIWDNANNKLGIRKPDPVFTVDVGGDASESIIRSSGLYVGSSGILFPSGNNGDSSYVGGRQLAHYEPNIIDITTGLNDILEASGSAKNTILLKKQNAGLVFAGPASGCTPPCSPDYPSFRPLKLEDIYDVYVDSTGVSLEYKLGINTSSFDGNITSYTNAFDPTVPSGFLGASYLASGLYGGGVSLINTSSTNTNNQNGYSIYTTGSGVNLNIDYINLANGTSSGVLSIQRPTSISTSSLNFAGQTLRIQNSRIPSSGNDIGNSGDICWGNSYLYVCVAPNTWKRTFLSSW